MNFIDDRDPKSPDYPRPRIKRLRLQIIVHSCIYYKLHDNIVSDDLWQKWADELTQLQEEYGTEWDEWDDDFADWNGNTGMHLPSTGWVNQKANQLLKMRDRGYK